MENVGEEKTIFFQEIAIFQFCFHIFIQKIRHFYLNDNPFEMTASASARYSVLFLEEHPKWLSPGNFDFLNVLRSRNL